MCVRSFDDAPRARTLLAYATALVIQYILFRLIFIVFLFELFRYRCLYHNIIYTNVSMMIGWCKMCRFTCAARRQQCISRSRVCRTRRTRLAVVAARRHTRRRLATVQHDTRLSRAVRPACGRAIDSARTQQQRAAHDFQTVIHDGSFDL